MQGQKLIAIVLVLAIYQFHAYNRYKIVFILGNKSSYEIKRQASTYAAMSIKCLLASSLKIMQSKRLLSGSSSLYIQTTWLIHGLSRCTLTQIRHAPTNYLQYHTANKCEYYSISIGYIIPIDKETYNAGN